MARTVTAVAFHHKCMFYDFAPHRLTGRVSSAYNQLTNSPAYLAYFGLVLNPRYLLSLIVPE